MECLPGLLQGLEGGDASEVRVRRADVRNRVQEQKSRKKGIRTWVKCIDERLEAAPVIDLLVCFRDVVGPLEAHWRKYSAQQA